MTSSSPFVITYGPYSGLYVIKNRILCFVKDEVRPYASSSKHIILDKVKNKVFYTSTPQLFMDKPHYTFAPQDAQDEYAYNYYGKCKYSNAIVFAVKNSMIDFQVIDNDKANKIIQWLREVDYLAMVKNTIDQSVDKQSVDQSFKQSVDQSFKQSVDQSFKQSVDEGSTDLIDEDIWSFLKSDYCDDWC